MRELPAAIIPVLRSTFLFLADTPSTDSAGRYAIAATQLVLRATYSVQDARRAHSNGYVRVYF